MSDFNFCSNYQGMSCFIVSSEMDSDKAVYKKEIHDEESKSGKNL